MAILALVALVATACSSGGDTTDLVGGDLPSDDTATNDTASDDANSDDVAGNEAAESIEEIAGSSGVTVQPGGAGQQDSQPADVGPVRTAEEAAQALGRGINFGNALDAPREGDWGVELEAADFVNIAEAGFDHVRLPVSWAGYAAEDAPYTIPTSDDPTVTHPDYNNIWERVDWAIAQAEANDLMLILNMHHYDEAHENPAAHTDRIIGIWQQIAERYASASNDVIFELFNEPNAEFTREPQLWNDLAAELIDTVRETNPTRPILAGPVGFNNIDELDTLDLPDDPYLIATVHLYEPFDFTHQGAGWLDDVPPLGARWSVDQVSFAQGFRDLSWETTSVGDAGSLRVDYSRQWAGFAFGWTEPSSATQVRFTASSDVPTQIQVGCQQAGNGHVDVERIDLTPEAGDYSVDLTSCAPGSIGVGILHASADVVPVRFGAISMCTVDGSCDDVLTNADASLRGWLQEAADWSNETGVPIHLGEFGAFDGNGAVPVDDRAAWTETIVDEANLLGIPFSYWEYNSSFGAYDQQADAWVDELRDALTG